MRAAHTDKYSELKKSAKVFLAWLLIFGFCLLAFAYSLFPRSFHSLVDFRPKPPYLPFGVPLQLDEMPSTTTIYFVASEDDEPLSVFLEFGLKNKATPEGVEDPGCIWDFLQEARRKILSTDSNGNQIYVDNENAPILHRYKVEISCAEDGQEKILFSRITVNPTGPSRNTLAALPTPPYDIKEDRIYKVQVTSEILAKRITEELEAELYFCQGCNGK